MECLIHFAASIPWNLVGGLVQEARYSFSFDDFVEELENEKNRLIRTRDDVEKTVEEGKKKNASFARVVHEWLKQAKTLTEGAEKLLEEARTDKTCCLGQCPNWICRYPLGKKIAKKKPEIEKCIEEGSEYIQIEHRDPLPGWGSFPSEGCLEFDSRKIANEDLMKALKDDQVAMIGLYGMAGCGKTTLAKKVRESVTKLFGKVAFATVSKTVNVQNIQKEIASSLQFELPTNEEMAERAQRLRKRISEEKKILVILDDVWQKLDFYEIGIPFGEDHKGCKVLITTRSSDICTLMDCQRLIHLQILTDEEAWTLFQKEASITESSASDLARQISNQCKGLPVAIVAVANSLKGKAEVRWQVALDRLEASKPVDIEAGLINPYNCLRLSYDYLDADKAKSLFLFCSVFPEDYAIRVEDLTRFAIGLGVVGEESLYARARNEVSAAIDKLVNSCMLLNAFAYEGKYVKMHDLVRDVAHWIAKDENKVIKCGLEEDVTVGYNSIRYLWCEKLPNQLDCSNLEFLRIETDLEEVSGDIFNGMGKLRVLVIRGWRKGSISNTESFKFLTNLRSLILYRWELGDISFVKDLKNLESLMLHNCSFLELPNDVTNLRLLDLSICKSEGNRFEVLGRYSQLEELYIIGHNIPERDFYKFDVPQTLRRYRIQFGDKFPNLALGDHDSSSRALYLAPFHPSNAAMMDLVKKTEILYISDIQGGAKNIIPDIVQIEGGGVHKLIELGISNSEQIECLVDTSNHSSEVGILFSKLLKLTIQGMKNLGALYHGPPVWKQKWGNIKDLQVKRCPKLTSLFTPAVAQSLGQLENLDISFCEKLERIFEDEEPQESSSVTLQSPGPFNRCNLKRLRLSCCSMLTSLFSPFTTVNWTSLEELKIRECHGLTYLVTNKQARKNKEKEIIQEGHDSQSHISVFPRLRRIDVKDCDSLEYIFPVSFAQSLVELKGIQIHCTPELRYVFDESIHDDVRSTHQYTNRIQIELPALENIILQEIPKMINICSDNYYATCSSLRWLEIKHVGLSTLSVNSLIGDSGHSATDIGTACKTIGLMLETVTIESMNEMEGIFHVEGLPVKGTQVTSGLKELNLFNLQELSYIWRGPKHFVNLQLLNELSISGCGKLKAIFSVSVLRSLPLLKILSVGNCEELEQIIEEDEEYNHEDQNHSLEFHIDLPALQRLSLENLPKIIDIFPKNCRVTCPSLIRFELIECPQCTTNSISDWMVCLDSREQDSTTTKDIGTASKTIGLMLETVSIKRMNKMEGIFHMEGLPVKGSQVTSRLKELDLLNLQEPSYIWRGPKHFVSLQHLNELRISGCAKLKAIFSASVLRSLPLLESLSVQDCEELEQIIEKDEENEDVPNPQSQKICFPKLKLLLVSHCNNLKYLFYISTSREFSQLKYLFIHQNSHLEEVFEGEQCVKEQVSLPKLELGILMRLPNLKNSGLAGVEFQRTLTNDLVWVYDCSKLSQAPTTTAADIMQRLDSAIHFEGMTYDLWIALHTIRGIIEKETAKKDPESETILGLQMSSENRAASEIEQPSSQVNGTRTNQSTPHDQTESGVTESNEFLASSEKKDKVTQHSQSLGHKPSPISASSNLAATESTEETESTPIGKVTASVKVPTPTITSGSEPRRPPPTSLAAPPLEVPLQKVGDQESASETAFLDKQHALGETTSIKEIVIQSVQEGSASEDANKQATLLAGVEQEDKPSEGETRTFSRQKISNGDDGIQKGSNFVNNKGKIDVVFNDSIEAPPGTSADIVRSHSLMVAKLGAFKPSVDMDEAHIALVAEAVAVYPHLWNTIGKFSERFQAWMLKTLADMLFFLRNENTVSVTHERKEEFRMLCDEAVQLGFERSWVDEMRQRVMVRDPEVDHAQARLSELLKTHDQLAQKLLRIKDEIKGLKGFVDSKKKCFDFP